MTSLPTAPDRTGRSASMAVGPDAQEEMTNRGGRSARSRWSRTTAGFAAVMAILLVGTWFVLLGTGQVTELATRPFSTWSLLAAEFATAGFLLAGAAGVARRRPWAGRVLLVALGMLLYTTVNTVGVSAEEGIWAAAAWMALVAAGSVVLVAGSLREPSI